MTDTPRTPYIKPIVAGIRLPWDKAKEDHQMEKLPTEFKATDDPFIRSVDLYDVDVPLAAVLSGVSAMIPFVKDDCIHKDSLVAAFEAGLKRAVAGLEISPKGR